MIFIKKVLRTHATTDLSTNNISDLCKTFHEKFLFALSVLDPEQVAQKSSTQPLLTIALPGLPSGLRTAPPSPGFGTATWQAIGGVFGYLRSEEARGFRLPTVRRSKPTGVALTEPRRPEAPRPLWGILNSDGRAPKGVYFKGGVASFWIFTLWAAFGTKPIAILPSTASLALPPIKGRLRPIFLLGCF